jgi:fused signal recognition particle receptor
MTEAADRSFLRRMRDKLNRKQSWLSYDLANLMPGRKIDADLMEELEAQLLRADVGIAATSHIIDAVDARIRRKELETADSLLASMGEIMLEMLHPVAEPLQIPDAREQPFVILMVGVNGAGKTTTAAKLCRRFMDDGRSVMLAAADTFRAAAVEQLQVWGERHRVPVVAQRSGADPAAVAFDAWQEAKANQIEVLVVDTAGRLHTQDGLMDELAKVKRVLARQDPAAPHEVMLVLDANQGQNALAQARSFGAAVGVTGITLTKLDGSARGGILLAIARELAVPVRYIGIGEAAEDLGPFDAAAYVGTLLQREAA